MKAIRVAAHGGPENLKLQELPSPEPGPGQALVQIAAAGVNFMDVGVRWMYWLDMPLPFTIGVEGAGQIVALGSGVKNVSVGDRIAWFYVPGSYAEEVVAPVDALVPIPDVIDDETAAAMMMQGLTASHFAFETYSIRPGDIALVHSAAGGVGLILTQIVKILGGKVIGRVSTESKAEIALAAGANHVIVERGGVFAEKVMRLTDGKGVQVVYDGAGGDTFHDSLASLSPHGVLAYYGQIIKRLPPIDLLDLPNSVHVTYPQVHDHVRIRDALLRRSQQLFDWVESGQLKINIGHRYPLADTAQAHTDLSARRTTGKLLLLN
jgi:NADPH2:quinone reductase